MSPQEPLLLVMAGSAIFTVGLLTLCVHFASALSRERILLWFGLFAAPYGLALILRSILLPEWDARVDLVVVIVGRLIGLASSIPALLLFREFYGKGWRLSSKWLIWAYAFAVVAVLFFMATHEHARAWVTGRLQRAMLRRLLWRATSTVLRGLSKIPSESSWQM